MNSGKANLWWLLIVLIAVIIGVWWWNSSQSASSLVAPITATAPVGTNIQGQTVPVTTTKIAVSAIGPSNNQKLPLFLLNKSGSTSTNSQTLPKNPFQTSTSSAIDIKPIPADQVKATLAKPIITATSTNQATKNP